MKQKTITQIRKSFREKYNNFVKDIAELNEKLVTAAKDVDEILGFMETTIKLQEDGEIPKKE